MSNDIETPTPKRQDLCRSEDPLRDLIQACVEHYEAWYARANSGRLLLSSSGEDHMQLRQLDNEYDRSLARVNTVVASNYGTLKASLDEGTPDPAEPLVHYVAEDDPEGLWKAGDKITETQRAGYNIPVRTPCGNRGGEQLCAHENPRHCSTHWDMPDYHPKG